VLAIDLTALTPEHRKLYDELMANIASSDENR
jgi:hypothetical protein